MKYKVGQKVKLDMSKIIRILELHWEDITEIVDLRVKGGYDVVEIIDIDLNKVLPYKVSPKLICDYYDNYRNLQKESYHRFHEDYFITILSITLDNSLFEI